MVVFFSKEPENTIIIYDIKTKCGFFTEDNYEGSQAITQLSANVRRLLRKIGIRFGACHLISKAIHQIALREIVNSPWSVTSSGASRADDITSREKHRN